MCSKKGGEGGTGVYMWEGTTLRVMMTDRPYGEFYDFYSVSLEYIGYYHVVCQNWSMVLTVRYIHDTLQK
jgi:hypothetical protein